MSRHSGPIRFLSYLAGTSPAASDLYSPLAAVRFTLLASILYAVLMSSHLDLQSRFAPLFRAFGNALFSDSFWGNENASVHFFDAAADDLFKQVDSAFFMDLPPATPIPRAQGEKDTLLFLQNENPPGAGFLRTGARLMAFTPAVILLVLVVTTPVSLRRRALLAIGSFTLLAAFVAFRMSILVIKGGFADAEKAWRLYNPGDFWRDVLTRVDAIVCDNPTFHYVAPVLIWAMGVIVLSMIGHILQTRRDQKQLEPAQRPKPKRA
jgi:hypothetical protein